jgi:hypothetical protein
MLHCDQATTLRTVGGNGRVQQTLWGLSLTVNTTKTRVRSFVRRRYIETLERPSQPHASSGTQTMSLQCNLRRHLLHKSSKPATHKVRDTTSNMYKA